MWCVHWVHPANKGHISRDNFSCFCFNIFFVFHENLFKYNFSHLSYFLLLLAFSPPKIRFTPAPIYGICNSEFGSCTFSLLPCPGFACRLWESSQFACYSYMCYTLAIHLLSPKNEQTSPTIYFFHYIYLSLIYLFVLVFAKRMCVRAQTGQHHV